MKPKISVSMYPFKKQYDVEVYKWMVVLQIRGELIEDLTNYAYETKEEAEEYVESLRDTYDVMEIKDTSGEEEMDENEFWKLIDLSLETKNTEEQRMRLIDMLSQMTDERIHSFNDRLFEARFDVYHHDNMKDAYRLAGVNGGDDSVSYFCTWLISRGKEIAEEVLENPMEIQHYLNGKNLTKEGAENELFDYVANEALNKKYKKHKV